MNFENGKPLKGKVVVITRPLQQAMEMAKIIEELDGIPLITPLLEIHPPDERAVEGFIRTTIQGVFDYIVFLSVNSIRSIFNVASRIGLANDLIKSMSLMKVIAIGSKTNTELKSIGLITAIVPDHQSNEGVLKYFESLVLEGLRIGIPRSSQAGEELKKALEARGAIVYEVRAYKSTPPSDQTKVLELIDSLAKDKVDIITFTSASGGRNIFEIAKQHGRLDRLQTGLSMSLVVAIGSKTQRTLNELGVEVDLVPDKYSIKGLIEALVRKYKKGSRE